MITRIYTNNFRCLVAFEATLDSFGVICGPNGSGKSSVFDVVRIIRSLGIGEAVLGGEGERDIPQLEFANWLKSTTQEFELSIMAEGRRFEYLLHLEQKANYEKPRIIKEEVTETTTEKRLMQR